MTAVTPRSTPIKPPPRAGRPENRRAYQGAFRFWEPRGNVGSNPLQHIPGE